LEAAQTEQANLGIAKLAAHRRFRLEAREPICILQTTRFFHPEIMAGIGSPEKSKSPGKEEPFRAQTAVFYETSR
jgi:hypothetical protein